MTDPAYLSVLVLVLVLGGSVLMIAVTLFMLNRALSRAGWPAGEHTAVPRAAAIVLIVWFAVAVALSWVGAYEGARDRLPTFPHPRENFPRPSVIGS